MAIVIVLEIEIEGPASLVLDALARLQLAGRDWNGVIRVLAARGMTRHPSR